ncbi:MAG: Ig-like domain-containing protein [Deltaproteobacteria bacterium]|nr:Ig-like domain-containing protein [Deltaproteobacteria bacterium]
MTRWIAPALLYFLAGFAWTHHPFNVARGQPLPIADNDKGSNEAVSGSSVTTRQSLMSARPSSEVAVGSITVQVVDIKGEPVSGAEVFLVVLDAGGVRREKRGKTDAAGKITYSSLAVGEQQAYLAGLSYRGARFRSPPFQLPVDRGYAVLIHRLETTRDHSKIVITGGQLSIWVGEERLEIGQTVQLLNDGQKSYVLPERGLLVRLPKGYAGLEPSPSMGDQHLSEIDGEGLKITGSLLPGASFVAWRFDLPISGSEIGFSVRMPWKVTGYRVVANQSSGLTLKVAQMPEATVVEEQGQRFLVTQIEPGFSNRPLYELKVTIGAIRGPSFLRWIAVVLAFVLLLVGVVAAYRSPAGARADPRKIELRQERILERAVQLKALRDARKLSEHRYQRAIAGLLTELSEHLIER